MSHCDFEAQLKSPLKSVGRHHYVHLDGFDLLPADGTARLVSAESLAQITRGDRYNVARFDNSHNRVALLNYPSFFENAFPALPGCLGCGSCWDCCAMASLGVASLR